MMNIEEITDDFMNRLPTHIVGFYKDKAEELFKEKIKETIEACAKEADEYSPTAVAVTIAKAIRGLKGE